MEEINREEDIRRAVEKGLQILCFLVFAFIGYLLTHQIHL